MSEVKRYVWDPPCIDEDGGVWNGWMFEDVNHDAEAPKGVYVLAKEHDAEVARLTEQLSSADEEMMTYFDEALDKAATEAQLSKQIEERKEAVRQRDRAVEYLVEEHAQYCDADECALCAFLSEIEEG